MGVIVQYVRLSSEQLERLARSPADARSLVLEGRKEKPNYPGAAVLDLDKAYQPIAWLLSPLARASEDHTYLLIRNRDEPAGAVRARVIAMDAMPVDQAFEALHGDRSYVDERFRIGLGPPTVFPPEKVRALSAALDKISRADLEREFDPAEMDRLNLCYLDEEDIMDEYILPEFKRLQAFYRAAAANNQVVMVVFT